MTIHIRTAFLSLDPKSVILVSSCNDAQSFCDRHPHETFYKPNGNHPDWLMLEAPRGLRRAYTSRCGDVGFVFNTKDEAHKWYTKLKNHKFEPIWHGDSHLQRRQRTVYLGDRLIPSSWWWIQNVISAHAIHWARKASLWSNWQRRTDREQSFRWLYSASNVIACISSRTTSTTFKYFTPGLLGTWFTLASTSCIAALHSWYP